MNRGRDRDSDSDSDSYEDDGVPLPPTFPPGFDVPPGTTPEQLMSFIRQMFSGDGPGLPTRVVTSAPTAFISYDWREATPQFEILKRALQAKTFRVRSSPAMPPERSDVSHDSDGDVEVNEDTSTSAAPAQDRRRQHQQQQQQQRSTSRDEVKQSIKRFIHTCDLCIMLVTESYGMQQQQQQEGRDVAEGDNSDTFYELSIVYSKEFTPPCVIRMCDCPRSARVELLTRVSATDVEWRTLSEPQASGTSADHENGEGSASAADSVPAGLIDSLCRMSIDVRESRALHVGACPRRPINPDAQLSSEARFDLECTAQQLLSQARALLEAKDYDGAARCYDRALDIYVRLHGNVHPQVAEVFADMAQAALEAEDSSPTLAKTYAQEAYNLYEATTGVDTVQAAKAFKVIAQAFDGEVDEPSDCAVDRQRYIKLCRRVYGEQHRELGIAYDLAAVLYIEIGDAQNAMVNAKKAVDILSKARGVGGQSMAAAATNLAVAYGMVGDLDGALRNFEKAAAAKEEVFGRRHPSLMDVYSNIAKCHGKMGDVDKAEQYMRKAFEIADEEFEAADPRRLLALEEEAMACKAAEKWQDAADFFQRLYICRADVSGQHHHTAASAAYEHANAVAAFDEREAAMLLERALSLCKRAVGEAHPLTARCRDRLAFVYTNIGEYDKAIPLHMAFLKLLRANDCDSNRRSAAAVEENLARCHLGKGDLDKADELLKKVLRYRMQAYGATHPLIASTYQNLAQVAEARGHIGKAIELAQKSYDICCRTLGANANISVKHKRLLEKLKAESANKPATDGDAAADS